MLERLVSHIPYFAVPFILALIITPFVRKIALKKGLISYPRPDRWHKKPTALLGGVGIYAAFIISVFYLGYFNRSAIGLITGGSFLFIIGLFDDKFHFTPYAKLFAQIVAGCIAIFFGITLSFNDNFLFSFILTLFWIIGITNAFNLLDNIDGLAVGIAIICASMLFFSNIANPLALYGLIIFGSALGFLPYNFNPAKIFMGDSGSMFLGYSLAVISISGTSRHVSNMLATMLVPVLILSVPIFDTLFVMIARKIRGRKIFEGGKDHTSHRLIILGLSQRKAALLLYAISAVFGSIALLYSRMNLFIMLSSSFLGAVILLFLGLFLFEVTSTDESINMSASHTRIVQPSLTILNTVFLHKRRMVEVLIDFALITIAYYLAYYLRFEEGLLKSNLFLFQESILWVILIKMSTFFIFGLYRGVWRYVSISDLITIFKAVSLSSVFSVLFLTFLFRFRDYSRAVFFIDWILLLFLVNGTRVFFRILGEFFSRTRESGVNVLIFGAGDTGEMVIREIKRNKQLNLNPIGFIDDDITKKGHKIQGVEVLGNREKISILAASRNIKEVLIAVPSISIEELSGIAKICKSCGVNYRRIRGLLDNKDDGGGFGEN